MAGRWDRCRGEAPGTGRAVRGSLAQSTLPDSGQSRHACHRLAGGYRLDDRRLPWAAGARSRPPDRSQRSPRRTLDLHYDADAVARRHCDVDAVDRAGPAARASGPPHADGHPDRGARSGGLPVPCDGPQVVSATGCAEVAALFGPALRRAATGIRTAIRSATSGVRSAMRSASTGIRSSIVDARASISLAVAHQRERFRRRSPGSERGGGSQAVDALLDGGLGPASQPRGEELRPVAMQRRQEDLQLPLDPDGNGAGRPAIEERRRATLAGRSPARRRSRRRTPR